MATVMWMVAACRRTYSQVVGWLGLGYRRPLAVACHDDSTINIVIGRIACTQCIRCGVLLQM